MSFNPSLNRLAIHQALQSLGAFARQPGTVYIFGGSALIHQGISPRFTKDIDLWSWDSNADVDAAVQQLKRQHISVDYVDPALFLPPLPGWQNRSVYAGTFGLLTVYYLDPYTITLTKIHRGGPQDLQDIQAMALHYLIQRDELIRLYQAIRSQLGAGAYRMIDPALFDGKFHTVIQTIR